jgi:Glycosyltransferases involved in cell wall biogenesis
METKRMSTVAIIMTTYNGEKYVKEQIDSILVSNYQDFELFIYDDGSNDNTVALMKPYEQQYPDKVHVFQNEKNLGLVRNFLHALSLTTMDYVMFCDQDDVWRANKIGITLKRLRNLEAQTGKDTPLAVFTDASVVDQNLMELQSSFFESNHLEPKNTDLAHLLMENKLIGCTVMINAAVRKVLQSNRLPQDAKYHDWWVALIAASFGKIAFVKESTLLYRQHENNMVGGADFISYIKNRLQNLQHQKEAIRALERQASEFVHLYGEQLSAEKRMIIQTFAELNEAGFLQKRHLILKNQYLKTGLIRNIGLFIII